MAKNPIFCDFSGGGGGPDPLSPSGSAHASIRRFTDVPILR